MSRRRAGPVTSDEFWEAMRLVDRAGDAVDPSERTCRQLAELWKRPYCSVDCYLKRLIQEGKVTSRLAWVRVGHCMRRVRVYKPVGRGGIGPGPESAKMVAKRRRGATR